MLCAFESHIYSRGPAIGDPIYLLFFDKKNIESIHVRTIQRMRFLNSTEPLKWLSVIF